MFVAFRNELSRILHSSTTLSPEGPASEEYLNVEMKKKLLNVFQFLFGQNPEPVDLRLPNV